MADKQKILFFDYESVIKASGILPKLAKNHALYLVSDQENIGDSLDKADLRKYFSGVFEQEKPGSVPKTDQWFYLAPIDELNLEKEKVTVIVRSAEGVSGAKKAGLPVIACTWESPERELLIEVKPDYLADHPLELLSILENIRVT